ncbi:MAG: hypothetical protein AB7N71_00500 [Phycisphaerae bacterium]
MRTYSELPGRHGRRAATLVIGMMAFATIAQDVGSVRMGRVRDPFPTGDERTSVLMLERMAPLDIRVGTEFEYTLTVRNITNAPIANVVLTEDNAEGFTMLGTNPEPAERGTTANVWTFASIEPNGSRSVSVRARADRTGEVTACASLAIRKPTCARLIIVEPQITLTKTMPPEVMACDPIPVSIVVTNPGSGTADNVVIRDVLPDGLTADNGQREVTYNVGSLAPGASREFRFAARATALGSFRNCATAEASGGLTANACAETRVVQPRLEIVKSGPNERYLGRPAQFEITVRNTGDAVAREVIVTDTIPGGLRFIAASDGGRFGGGQVQWSAGNIEPGASRTFGVECVAERIGDMVNRASARGYCCDAATELPIVVRGIPAVLLEVIDVEDPDEIGTTETYIITVTNQGSADATGIRITCEIQPEAEFVSASADFGLTASNAGRTVTFAPLEALAPKAKANFRVIVRGQQAGDTRFAVSMTTDQTTSPVEETESTRFY